MNKNFLVEIGTEELPYKILKKISIHFYENFIFELKNKNIKYKNILWFSTSRRLAIKVINITKYNINFFQEIVENSLKNLSKFKFMKWNEKNIKFIRPIRNVILLLDDILINCKILGIKSTQNIYGHRFMGKKNIKILNANDYPAVLYTEGKVIADFNKRKKIICNGIKKISEKLKAKVKINEKFLEEITSLTEWPYILKGNLNKDFIKIPEEILVKTIHNSQKYIFLYDLKNILLPYFIFISNLETNNNNYIIQGYEKVINNKLEDINFFFNLDTSYKIEYFLLKLKNITFQKTLGSLFDRTYRIASISKWIAKKININFLQAERAGILSKFDLSTNIVFEYPELQGIAGMYYAIKFGVDINIAIAIREQYLSHNSLNELPNSLLSCSLSIADKIDNLVSMFILNKKFSGNKDPFAIRRLTISILNIILNKKINININKLILKSINLFNIKINKIYIFKEIKKFIFNRLKFIYLEKGYRYDIIESLISCNLSYLDNFNKRIKILKNFNNDKNSYLLKILSKRIIKIIKKSKEKIKILKINNKYLLNKYEIKILKLILIYEKKIDRLCKFGLYKKALKLLENFIEPINEFFNFVKIMDKCIKIRINRLILLKKIHNLFLKIGNISILN